MQGMIIAGIDEAGYGPLLGPLVVSATALEVPGEMTVEADGVPCLWQMLKGAVAKKAPVKKGRLLIADSKVVHNLTDGDKFLERGVLAFMRSMEGGNYGGELSAHAVMEISGCTNHELTSHPWYAPASLLLPRLAEAGDLGIASNMLEG